MDLDKQYNFSGFQTFYVSKEESSCPLISKFFEMGKKIKQIRSVKDYSNVIISMKYGKRVLINTENSDISELEKEKFLEIVDFDPVRNVLLVLGSGIPREETPLHWFIHHAKQEINVIVQIKKIDNVEKLIDETSKVEEDKIVSFKQVKQVLINLRDSDEVIIKNQGILLVGNNPQEVEEQLSKIM